MIDEKNIERAKQGILPPCGNTRNYPMQEFFSSHAGDRFTIGFKELGRTRGNGILPPSAYEYDAWWSYDFASYKHRHALAWLNEGWGIEHLSLADEEVVFIRFK